MKKLLLIAGIVCMFSAATYAAGPIGFGVQLTGANINMPDPFKEVYGFGYGGGVHLDINLPMILAIRVQGDYVTFGIDDAKFKALLVNSNPGTVASEYTVDGGRINILSVIANAKISPLPLPIVSPYLTGGIGMANVGGSDFKITRAGQTNTAPLNSETNFSANLGAGVDLNLIALKLYLELRYTWIFASGATSTYVPVSLGITF